MKKYNCNNPKLENYLAEHGIEPMYYDAIDGTAIYLCTKRFQELLEKFEIKYLILRSKY